MTVMIRFRFDWGQKFTDTEFERLKNISGQEIELDETEKTLKHYPEFVMSAFDARLDIVITNDPGSIGEFGPREPRTIVNEKCKVVVPGLGLLEINQVKNENDYCTDRLNDDLKNGWKILAICPQPDQRRPDYILGKSPQE